jgi:hypothetical protein
VAQHSNEHLTIAKLSAYIDDELAPEELALCDAHIQTCQPCQAALADLRLTSALLGSLPRVAVPRSFTLPTNFVMLPETPDTADGHIAWRSSSHQTPAIWRRSLRVVSALAAVLGLLFFLAGALSSLPHGGSMNASSSSTSAGIPVEHPASAQTASVQRNTPQPHFSPDARATYAATVMLTPTLISTPPAYGNTQSQNQPPAQQPGLPPALDPGQPQGRLTIGVALLLLGIAGVFVARLPARGRKG